MLILKDTFELAKNAISKYSIIFKVLLEKILEFFLRHQIFGFRTTVLLVLLLNYCSVEKQDGKKNLIWPIGLSGFKMVFTLLVKLIVI